MRKTERILAAVLSLVLLLSTVPLRAASASNNYVPYAVEGGNIYFDPATGTVVQCDTSVTSAVIPAEIGGVAVTAIGQLAFYDCTRLTGICVESETMSVGAGAFRYCDSLSEVKFAGTVTELGNYAFDYCDALASLSLRCSDLTVGKYAFRYCTGLSELRLEGSVRSFAEGALYCCSSLVSMEIPEGVTTLGDYAFGLCSKLTEIHLPASLTSMGVDAFGACSGLKRFTVAEGNTAFYADEHGVLYNGDKTVLIEYPVAAEMTEYTVLQGVTAIPDSAFDTAKNLEYVCLPEGVTSIGQYAFTQCYALREISLPSTLQSIGGDAFTSCTSLREINLPESLTEIGEQAFSSCSALSHVTVPGGVKNIPRSAFISCGNITTLVLGEGVETIGPFAFRGCTSLTDIVFPASLRTIGTGAFRNNYSLPNLSIPEGLTTIGNDAFCFCYDLTFAALPDTLTSIGEDAFLSCGDLRAVSVPGTTQSIGSNAFGGCEKLTVYGETGSEMEKYAAENGLTFVVGGVSPISGSVKTPRGEAVGNVAIWLTNTQDETDYFVDFTDGQGSWHVPFAGIGKTYEVTYRSKEYPDNGVDYVYTVGPEPVIADVICVIKTGFMRSGAYDIQKLDMTEMNYVMRMNYPVGGPYATQPSVSQPYSSGALTQEHLDLALERLNDMRLIAGVPAVTLDDTYNAYCQDGALVSAVNYGISHYPSRPSGMDYELFRRGYTACGKSNLAYHPFEVADCGPLGESVDMYLDDSDLSNIENVGHRRWALNPRMGKTGFGLVNNGSYQYCTMFAHDTSGGKVDYDFIAWPSSGNFPLDVYDWDLAWSVTLNPERFSIPSMSDLTITVTEAETGKEFVISGDREYPIGAETMFSEYLNVSYTGCGEGPCIIFRPDCTFVTQGVYTVRIDGLHTPEGQDVSLYYYVNLQGVNHAETDTEYGFCNYGLEWSRSGHKLFYLKGVSELPCELYLAAYDPSGKMIDMEYVEVDMLESVYTLMKCPDGTLVKLFRLDEEGCPASAVWSHQF